MEELRDIPVGEIAAKYIVGESQVSEVAVMPDEPNRASKIGEIGVEDSTMTEGMERQVRDVCNLSMGVWEDGLEEGLERGRENTLADS